jgi:hypothetical protein
VDTPHRRLRSARAEPAGKTHRVGSGLREDAAARVAAAAGERASAGPIARAGGLEAAAGTPDLHEGTPAVANRAKHVLVRVLDRAGRQPAAHGAHHVHVCRRQARHFHYIAHPTAHAPSYPCGNQRAEIDAMLAGEAVKAITQDIHSHTAWQKGISATDSRLEQRKGLM